MEGEVDFLDLRRRKHIVGRRWTDLYIHIQRNEARLEK